MAYISVAVEVDPSAITQEKVDQLQAAIPGLVVQVGSVLYAIVDTTSERDAINAQLITDVTDLIWDTFGGQILRVPRLTATQATGDTTWTRLDSTSDLTIPAGTGLSLASDDGISRVAFVTRSDVTIPAGSLTTAVGEVGIIAATGGADSTGLQDDPQPDETLPWLDSITVEFPTAGGEDDEDEDTYRDRLGDEASLMARTLVRPEDFATRARDITGVDLALALDLYDPGPPVVNPHSGHITVAVRDVSGVDPGATVRANVLAELDADSVSILTPHVIPPTPNVITVVFTAVAYASFDAADVEARAEQAVLDFLNPATWGLPPFGDQRMWIDKPIVRYRDVIAAIESVEGLDYTRTITGTGNTTSGSANVTAVSTTAGWKNGQAISGSGIPTGTRILSGAGTTTLVLSANATATATGVALTGTAVTVNNLSATDVTMTGPAAVPSLSSTADGTVIAGS